MKPAISMSLAMFAAETRWHDLPQAVQREALRALTNGVAAGLGGASDVAVDTILRSLLPFSGGGGCTVIGRLSRSDMSLAAFVNAAAINVLDFDETHVGTIIHPVAPVAGAALALAEETGASGAALLEAITVGVEAACRIGNAVSPGHYARGWHITATCGVFGAALASARLLGLDPSKALHALGIASAQSSGLVETLGTMAKSVGVGHAARAGLMSAIMAREGIEGPAEPLEGRLGFLTVTADPPDPTRVLAGLGSQWELQRIMYKPYPCGVVLNPVIDACLSLRESVGARLDDIVRVDVQGSELLRARTDRPHVTQGREAQVSAQHAVAVSVLRGAAGAQEFSDAAVADPAVLAIRGKVGRVIVDPSMAEDAALVRVHLADGQLLEKQVTAPLGSLEAPLSDALIAEKLRTLAAFGAPLVDADSVLTQLAALPGASSIAPLMQALQPA